MVNEETDDNKISVRQDQPQDYALPYEKTDTNDNHDYEELFWEPANQEEELMAQLSMLGLPVILSESVE